MRDGREDRIGCLLYYEGWKMERESERKNVNVCAFIRFVYDRLTD